MKRYDAQVVVTVWICSVAMSAILLGETAAATKKANESVSERPVSGGAKKRTPALQNNQVAAIQKQATRTQSAPKPGNSKGHHRLKVSKKVSPTAVLRPRTELTYHGMLENSQRYDPRLNHRTAGVQDPQTPALAHDHFLELDRNQDGKIDPVERAFSRLDMDRDLPNRQP